MEKVFQYRKHIRFSLYIVYAFLVIGILMSVGGIVLFFVEEDSSLIIFSIFFVSYMYLISLVFKRMASTKITINSEGVGFENSKKSFFIKYEDIVEVNTKSIKSVGGYFIIVGPGKHKIRITVVLENIGVLVKELREQLDRRALKSFDKEKLYNFYLTSSYSDQSWQRLYSIGLEFIIFMVLFFLSSVFSFELFKYANVIGTFMFGSYIILGVFMIFYLYKEYGVYNKELRSNKNKNTWELPNIDIESQKKELKISLRIAYISWLVFVLINLI